MGEDLKRIRDRDDVEECMTCISNELVTYLKQRSLLRFYVRILEKIQVFVGFVKDFR